MDIKEKLKRLPDRSGVYIMKSKSSKVLYVGKASSLRNRVSSYFSKSTSAKTMLMMEEVVDFEYITCENPEQALILVII